MKAVIQTHSGRFVDVLSIQTEDILLEDIAHALANLCRFNGHCNRHYSVAEHSVLVLRVIKSRYPSDKVIQRAALLHDAAEAYLVDVPRPLKRHTVIGGLPYAVIESRVLAVISDALDVDLLGPWDAIKEVDAALLATEAKWLMSADLSSEFWVGLPDPMPAFILEAMPECQAKETFLHKARELGIPERFSGARIPSDPNGPLPGGAA